MDDSMQKRYEDIKKKYDTKTAQPYRSTSFRKQQQYNEQASAYPVPMQNQLVQQQGFPALAGWNQLGQMLQSQVPNMSAFGQFQQPTSRFRARHPIDKSNSLCKACQGIGH